MEMTVSPERRWLLLDKSVLVRGPRIDATLGEPCLCAITRLEMLYSARSDTADQKLEAALDVVYEKIERGEIKAVRIDKTVRISSGEMDRYLNPTACSRNQRRSD